MPEITTDPSLSEHQTVCISELRKLIKDSELDCCRTDDTFFQSFLECCDWDVNKAYDRLQKWLKFKKDHPNWFISKPLHDYKSILEMNAKYVLDKRDKLGRRIYVYKIGNVNTSKATIYDMAQLDDLWLEFMLSERDTLKNGITSIIDMSGFSWKMLKWFTPNNMKIASAKAELIPAKQMHFHVVNSSALMNTTVSLVFPFLGQNIKDHVHFHYTDWASLHQHVDKEALPTEYGGTADVDPTELYAQLEKCPQLSTDCLQLNADFSKKLDLDGKEDRKTGKSKSKKEKV